MLLPSFPERVGHIYLVMNAEPASLVMVAADPPWLFLLVCVVVLKICTRAPLRSLATARHLFGSDGSSRMHSATNLPIWVRCRWTVIQKFSYMAGIHTQMISKKTFGEPHRIPSPKFLVLSTGLKQIKYIFNTKIPIYKWFLWLSYLVVKKASCNSNCY